MSLLIQFSILPFFTIANTPNVTPNSIVNPSFLHHILSSHSTRSSHHLYAQCDCAFLSFRGLTSHPSPATPYGHGPPTAQWVSLPSALISN